MKIFFSNAWQKGSLHDISKKKINRRWKQIQNDKIKSFWSTFSPCGRKFRSKPQLARFLGDSFDLSAFDFRSGKQLSSGARKSKRLKNIQYDYSRGLKHDASLVLPIRQTASIFKQPVTLKTNHGQNRIKADPKQDAKDVPKQVPSKNQEIRPCQTLVMYSHLINIIRKTSCSATEAQKNNHM